MGSANMSYKNYPIAECSMAIEDILRKHPHAAVYQKWTCSGCGKRITGNTANQLFEQGHCEECGHITDLRKTGCNYAVHLAVGGVASMPHEGTA